jgi:hypothetical protein
MAALEDVARLQSVALDALSAQEHPVGAAVVFDPVGAVVDHPSMAPRDQPILGLDLAVIGATDHDGLAAQFYRSLDATTIVIDKLWHVVPTDAIDPGPRKPPLSARGFGAGRAPII